MDLLQHAKVLEESVAWLRLCGENFGGTLGRKLFEDARRLEMEADEAMCKWHLKNLRQVSLVCQGIAQRGARERDAQPTPTE